MKEQSQNNASSQFLKTDGGKTKSNAIEVPSISLPKGGGAIKGIDEKFSVNAVNGTASFSIPLPFSSARGASPSLSLSYNSGSGNGIFGLGWNLSLGSIKRKTDKGLPQYFDAIDSDTFLFSEAEDLVPEFKKNPDGSFQLDPDGEYITERNSLDGLFTIRNYRPRIEGLFARIERWTDKSNRRIKWRVINKENSTTLFGWTDNSIIKNPDDPAKIYEWLPEFVFDDKGNCTQYIYKKEDDIGFDASLLHNCNRLNGGNISYTNLYIDKVLYGNKTPYKQFGDAFPGETDYMFQTIFDYGTILTNDSFDAINEWDFRTDAFSDYKAGFEIRTTRLCKRVLLFHVFEELAVKQDKSDKKTLIKSTDFKYIPTSEQGFTFLRAITACGYIKKSDGTYSSKKLPDTEFEYQAHEWNKEVKIISVEDLVHAPSGLDDQHYHFTDLFNEGLSGILTEQGNGWYYKHNLGDGKFEEAEIVTPKPSFVGLGGQLQLADLDADGGKQLVSYGTEPKGYFELDDDNEWQPFRTFQNLPNIDFGDSNTRMLDLNGDGKPEVLITDDNIFTWYQSDGRDGFSQINKAIESFDEEKGPHVVFSNAEQTIFLADMSGDGMTDIVRIRNGEACYWPNLGYGKFGAKVAMDNAPLFDCSDSFNPSFLRLADIDGSGTSDIIYLGENTFTCWMNLNGNGFSTTPFEINTFPDIHSHAKITVTDLLGNGIACIVWSSGLPKDAGAPLRYIDLMNSKKPHIMVSYKNNLGKEVSMEYTPSTKFYIEDKLAGKPWITKLHFPVHCISKTETRDKISGHCFVSSYKYHHGYYDHAEREFRGFGMVEQIDAEDFEHWVKRDATNITDATLHQEPVVSKTWTHTGAFLSREKILCQFAHEYWYEEVQRQGFSVSHHEAALPDAWLFAAPGISTAELDNLSAREWQEALRACKGMALRSETFAKDANKFGNTPEAIQKELTPFSVATHNCVIELLQPRGKNKHAVFVVKESEAITYSYERNTEDPRISHSLSIKLDEFGNVLESASVVYPRVLTDGSLPLKTQEEQSKTVIIYSQHQFTNDVMDENIYRLRLPSEVKTFELKGVAKTGSFYAVNDFENILSTAGEVAYPDFDSIPLPGNSQKRLIEHVRSNYYNNNLRELLPLYHLDSLAIPFESYQLAYTPGLVTDIFDTKVNPALLTTEGKFTSSEGDGNWWIRSGTTQFIDGLETKIDAQNRFYVPVSYTDPYGSKTNVSYYSNYFLFIEETEDELKNKSRVDLFNFRTLSPQRMRDINNNFSEAISDELGLVKAMAVFGKGNEADDLTNLAEYTTRIEQDAIDSFFTTGLSTDLINQGKSLLQHATARFVYDFDVYARTGKPAVVASIVREEHFQKNSHSPVQLSFEYSGGLGKVVMKKVQAEPGLAKQVNVNADGTIHIAEINTAAGRPRQLRWIGNGRTILNNKGNAVKQYEPYFSVTHQYEDLKELVETGVTPIMYYDAMGRAIKTEMPDGTFSKVEFDSWKQVVYDANDTVLDSAWYLRRTNPARSDFITDTREQRAAAKAVLHANTPNVLHFDTLGRPVLSIDHNKNIRTNADEFYRTKIILDTEGNLRNVTDARGNTVMRYKYDMLGHMVYQHSMDAGDHWMLTDTMGKPTYVWDFNERFHAEGGSSLENRIHRTEYDAIHRPLTQQLRINESVWMVTERFVYGDTQPHPADQNLRGQVYQHDDPGGRVTNLRFDFNGNLLEVSRQLTHHNNVADVLDWSSGLPAGGLELELFTQETAYDALKRMTRLENWHFAGRGGGIFVPQYNARGSLQGETLTVGEVRSEAILNIEYDAKGQHVRMQYGNGTTTRYHYDPQNFRLQQMRTTRRSPGDGLPTAPGNLSDPDVLQNLYYTYDAAGNITEVLDDAYEPVFFNNQMVEPRSQYTYDALYRLIEATGREHATMNDAPGPRNSDILRHSFPRTDQALHNYRQRYTYDSVGNILEMQHAAGNGNMTARWTRHYQYANDSNRLLRTWEGSDETAAVNYAYDAHGSMLNFSNSIEEMRPQWDYRDMIQSLNLGGGGIACYHYDSQKQRSRKRIVRPGGIVEDRMYLGGMEWYRRFRGDEILEEIETQHLFADSQRVLIVEDVLQSEGSLPLIKLYRYQYSNHLDSVGLELDADAAVISYEEYHPYGTTAYSAFNSIVRAAAKRYRYTGMERDEETGLEYHSARYYLPWLGRWGSADPSGIESGIDFYLYCQNNPINRCDTNGLQDQARPAGIPSGPRRPTTVGGWARAIAMNAARDEIAVILAPIAIPAAILNSVGFSYSEQESAAHAFGMAGEGIGAAITLARPFVAATWAGRVAPAARTLTVVAALAPDATAIQSVVRAAPVESAAIRIAAPAERAAVQIAPAEGAAAQAATAEHASPTAPNRSEEIGLAFYQVAPSDIQATLSLPRLPVTFSTVTREGITIVNVNNTRVYREFLRATEDGSVLLRPGEIVGSPPMRSGYLLNPDSPRSFMHSETQGEIELRFVLDLDGPGEASSYPNPGCEVCVPRLAGRGIIHTNPK